MLLTHFPILYLHRQYDGLPELLATSDYVCSILPSTAETRGLLDGDILKHCSAKVPILLYVLVADVQLDSV